MCYVALAYYLFTPIDKPERTVLEHKIFFKERECTGRIYLSEEGVNGQMSGQVDDVEAYMLWLKSDPRFASIEFKIHTCKEQIFPRMSVKYRKQLVALDQKVDPADGAEHVSPARWKEMLESQEYLLLDVRNQYESRIGHFEGAILPPLENFRDFPEYAENLSQQVNPKKTKVMMYCTGGIRCELYSVLLKQKGFDEVYQLDGGVINYGLKEGSQHWKGRLFVFDDRLAISIDGKESEPIAQCAHCLLPEDTYHNCANMDCNALFICCSSCLEVYQGCCCHSCKESPRVRPLDPQWGNRPFRKKHLIGCAVAKRPVAAESHCEQLSNQA